MCLHTNIRAYTHSYIRTYIHIDFIGVIGEENETEGKAGRESKRGIGEGCGDAQVSGGE